MRKIIKHINETIKLFLAEIIGHIMMLNKKNREIYLIGERKNEAKDNGYHLFKYVRNEHPEDQFYYVIEKDSKDLNKISGLGNIIYYDTLKHYIYYVMSKKLICAHVGSCTPDAAICWILEEKKIIKKYKIFVQHGITKELIPSLMYENTGFNEFICGAKPEYEFVKKEFGYKEDSVKYLGFCRFDNLHNFVVKNQILIMPTWRKWIPSATWTSNETKEKIVKEFLETDYYKNYNELINNDELIYYLEKNNMRTIFYLHYEMQGYRELFKSKSDRVIIGDDKSYDVQELLKESKLLITDYSSIAFDFAYMKKPIIYFQFDREEYDKKHYSKGYFDYERDGFGIKVNDINRLVKGLKLVKINDKKYIDKVDKFFEIYDGQNCERTYDEIKRE